MSIAAPSLSDQLTLPTSTRATSLQLESDLIATAIAMTATVVATALRVWASAAVGLGYGETYYLACSREVALGYFDQPPMTAWMLAATTWLTGSTNPLVVRTPFIMLFPLTCSFLFFLTRRLAGAWPACWAVLLANLTPVFALSVGAFAQPDAPLFFFLTLACWALARILFPREGEPKAMTGQWLLVGFAIGAALLSKYHAVMAPLGLLVFLLGSTRHRPWLLTPGPWAALTAAALLFLPVIYWNNQHEWVSFRWQMGRGSVATFPRFDWFARSVGGQLLWLTPWIGPPLAWELVRAWSIRDGRSRWKWLALTAAPAIIGFTVVAAWAPVGFHFHWQAPGYWLLLPALGATIHERFRAGSVVTKRWLFATLILSPAAMIAVTSHAANGWWTRGGPKNVAVAAGAEEDPTLECIDFAPLADALAQWGVEPDGSTFVFSNRWFLAGKIDHAVGDWFRVACFHPLDQRGFAFRDRSSLTPGMDAILVSTRKYMENPHWEFDGYFERIEPLGQVALTRGGQTEQILAVFRCHGLRRPYPSPYR